MLKNKKLAILALLGLALIGSAIVIKSANLGTAALWQISNGGRWLLPLVFVSALVDSINPCAFSILLLTIAFLFSVGKLRSSILKIGGAYIFGIFSAYLLIGLGVLRTLQLFNVPRFMGKAGATLLIILGVINVINEFFPAFPLKFRIPHFAHHKMAELTEKASLPAAFFLGMLVGLCEFPCTGGPYLMILGLLHDQATYLIGVSYLIFYNLVFILPLAVILLIASNKALLAKAQEWQKKDKKLMKFGGGVAMIILGVIIFLL